MTGSTEQTPKKTLTLGKKLDPKKASDTDQVRQSFAHGRSKAVAVEVKRRRAPTPSSKIEETPETIPEPETTETPAPTTETPARRLTDKEMEVRLSALKKARKDQVEQKEEESIADEDSETTPPSETDEAGLSVHDFPRPTIDTTARPSQKPNAKRDTPEDLEEEDDEASAKRRAAREELRRTPTVAVRKDTHQPRKLSRQVITRAMNDEEERTRSIAALRRARLKHRQANTDTSQQRIVRDVIVSDFITVSDLANRMAIRGAEVVKALMKLGMMVTINQVIDADTAELVCGEFGHKIKRVSASDVELGLKGEEDQAADLSPRAPVVTVMGHVDHGKTSLLDALRRTNVVSGEAGGITQHIGAYQVQMQDGAKITFIDTPGHAAFTEMRARGANITDIVVLVVAADDGIKEQTIEAIHHAKAAQVPIVVAINKIDKPEANPDRVRSELLQHEVVLEEFGGDVLSVEVSAKKGMNLEKLEETILLQAEVLNLRANPNRMAYGTVIEARLDKGRGMVATILVQSGTLKTGDIFVVGKEWGRVRALANDLGQKTQEAGPATPVEVLGLNGLPKAGDEFSVVADEGRAREVAQYRQQRDREAKAAAQTRGSMEQMMSRIAAGEREVPIVVKADVQGSLEAIIASLTKLNTEEVVVRILHSGVGAITEGDVTLANASQGVILGFNVRANHQALDLARQEHVDIRYYSVIYNIIDDIKVIMGGLLAPTLHEKYLGSAEIREVFNITKIGKIAGCYVRDGLVKRGASVRLLRDNIVIHEGMLKTLKRFKEEVREVKESYECGMAFENYNDIQPNDVIECFEIESQARVL